MRAIIVNELRNNFLSIRLHLTLLLTVLLFGAGTLAFVKNQQASREQYQRYQAESLQTLREKAEKNLSSYAQAYQVHVMPPRDNAFIDDSRERYIPDRVRLSAYVVRDFSAIPENANPLMKLAQELNWAYIVSVIIGFAVLLFTFDTISGEKEAKTLALILSNSVSRGTVLFGKYLSAVLTTVLLLIAGLALSLVILFITGTVPATPLMAGEIFGFLLAATIFIAVMASFGVLSSMLVRSANVSLLIAVAFWMMFVMVVPNTAFFWGRAFFPIESADSVNERIQRECDALGKAADGMDGFARTLVIERRIRDASYPAMFRQFERTRALTYLSPVSLFEYMSESIVDGGYVRFRKNWDDLHAYQDRLFSFFRAKDAADPESPHVYDPVTGKTTRKPVRFEEIPRYEERTTAMSERMARAGAPFAVMILYGLGVFALTGVLFARYDVR